MLEIAHFLQKIALFKTVFRLIILFMDVLDNFFMTVCTSSCNAAVHSVYIKKIDRIVTLVLPTEESHMSDPSYSGNTIFPFAGRIRGGIYGNCRFDLNDGANSIHGGSESRKAVFLIAEKSDTRIVYTIERAAGQDGLMSGRVYTVEYSLSGNELVIVHRMTSSSPVLTDTTCHLYFNLSGEKTVGGHFIRLDSDEVLINDEEHCGLKTISLDGSALDLRSGRMLEEVCSAPCLGFSRGLNNAYILKKGSAVRLSAGGLSLEASSDSPAVVIYSGGFLEEPSSFIALEFQSVPLNECRSETKDYVRRMRFRFCLENSF